MVEDIVREEPPTTYQALVGLARYPYLSWANVKLDAYVDVFVEKFLGIPQGPAKQRQQVRKTLLHFLDKVFRPCDSSVLDNHKEVFFRRILEKAPVHGQTARSSWVG